VSGAGLGREIKADIKKIKKAAVWGEAAALAVLISVM
jgi:hypothetical protein